MTCSAFPAISIYRQCLGFAVPDPHPHSPPTVPLAATSIHTHARPNVRFAWLWDGELASVFAVAGDDDARCLVLPPPKVPNLTKNSFSQVEQGQSGIRVGLEGSFHTHCIHAHTHTPSPRTGQQESFPNWPHENQGRRRLIVWVAVASFLNLLRFRDVTSSFDIALFFLISSKFNRDR